MSAEPAETKQELRSAVSADVDLRASARRGLLAAALLCLVATIISAALSQVMTDEMHRGMSYLLTGGLFVATLALLAAGRFSR